jgi:hypothetical protein
MDYEFVYKVDADIFRKEKRAGKGKSSSAIRSVCLKESELSKQAIDRLCDVEEWTGFGNVISFKDETEQCFRVLLLDFLPLEVGKCVAGIQPQMASFNHADLTSEEIERKISGMGMQWNRLKRGIYFQEMQQQCEVRFGEITPQGIQMVVNEALQTMGGSENFPVFCRWEGLENDSAEGEIDFLKFLRG